MERYRSWRCSLHGERDPQAIGALFNPKMTPEMKEVQLAYVERRLNTLEKLLEGKQYASGGKLASADAYCSRSSTGRIAQDRSRQVAEPQGVPGAHRGPAKVQETMKRRDSSNKRRRLVSAFRASAPGRGTAGSVMRYRIGVVVVEFLVAVPDSAAARRAERMREP